MGLVIIVHQRQVAVRGEGGGGRLCRVGIAHAHHQQEHHHQGVLVNAAAGGRFVLPVIRGRGGGGLPFRHIQIVLVDIPGGLRDNDLIPVAALADDLHLGSPEQMADHRMFHAGAGAEVQVGVAADIDCADSDGLCLRLGISVPTGITAHQGLHDLLQPLSGKGDLPILTDSHALRQDDLCSKGNAVRQGGAAVLRSVPGSLIRFSGGSLHGLRLCSPAGGGRGALRREANGGEVAHHQNASQKAGDHALKFHPVHPP